MKTIEVTDEMYNSLMELSKEMTSQDMRGTQMPHMFQVRDWKEVPAYEGNGDKTIWINEDHDEMSESELQAIVKEGLSLDGNVEDILIGEFEAVAFLNDKGYFAYDVDVKPEYSNTFFTAKAAKNHLRLNHYHFNENADVFLNHAWRNPEMELVSQFLCELSGGELHK